MPTRFMRDVRTDKSRLWKCGAYRIVQVTHPIQYSVYTCMSRMSAEVHVRLLA